MKFWDASAIVPLLIGEATTQNLQRVIADDPDMLVWWGSPIECASALARRERSAALHPREAELADDRLKQFAAAWYEIEPSEIVARPRSGFFVFIRCVPPTRCKWPRPLSPPNTAPRRCPLSHLTSVLLARRAGKASRCRISPRIEPVLPGRSADDRLTRRCTRRMLPIRWGWSSPKPPSRSRGLMTPTVAAVGVRPKPAARAGFFVPLRAYRTTRGARGAGPAEDRGVWWSYLWIAVGSALGGVGRFALSGWVAERIGEVFPWGTLIVNASGSFVIGFFHTLTEPGGRLLAGPTTRQFVMIGICGGYTTFSSFSLQTLNLVREGDMLRAFGNIAGSVVLCLAAVWLGHIAAVALNR